MIKHRIYLFVPAALVLLGCGQSQTAPEPAPVRVENADLGLAIAALPQPFALVASDKDAIRLSAEGAGGAGSLVITVGQAQSHGVNLVAAAKAGKEHFEGLPGGEFFGNRELIVPGGTAYTVRGSYERDGVRVGEMWALALHPADPARMLKVVYVYPDQETPTRAPQLLTLVGEIEALSAAGGAAGV